MKSYYDNKANISEAINSIRDMHKKPLKESKRIRNRKLKEWLPYPSDYGNNRAYTEYVLKVVDKNTDRVKYVDAESDSKMDLIRIMDDSVLNDDEYFDLIRIDYDIDGDIIDEYSVF